ncbi:MAG TPA: hypothetical protein VIT64_13685 [Ilumatobacteraceae bacterium]
MRRQTLRTAAAAQQVISDDLSDRWIEIVLASVRGDTQTVETACHDLVDALTTRPEELNGALARFGRELGGEGWLLTELSAWIGVLASVAGTVGLPLRRFEAGAAVAQGWADGYLYGLQAFDCTDSLTGLVTLPVLRLRLGQIYDQCAALGVATDQVYCLAIIDTDFGDRSPLERDAAMVVIGDQVLRTYGSGETAAVKDGRVLILISRIEATYGNFRDLLAQLHVYPLLTGGHVIGWIEELPSSLELVDRYLVDLAA